MFFIYLCGSGGPDLCYGYFEEQQVHINNIMHHIYRFPCRLKRHHVFNSKEFNEVEVRISIGLLLLIVLPSLSLINPLINSISIMIFLLQLYSDITFSPALDEDTVSIKTCYDSLDLTAYAIHTVDDEELHSAQKKMITAKRLVERNANTDPNQVHSTDTTNSDFIDTDSNNVMKSDAANRDFANHLSHRLIVTATMEGSDGIVDFNYLCTTENGVKLIRVVHRNDTLSIVENNDNPITTDKVPVADKTTLDDHRSNSRSSSASSSNQHQYENMHQVVVT